jgi:hypothetical protein
MRRLWIVIVLLAAPLRADEGMWTFDNPPLQQLKEKYGFTPTKEWLEHVRLSSVRFNDGGSGSFVSQDGLVLTNHHVGFGQLQKMSTAEKDYVKNGFFARSRAEEIQCADLELNVLVSVEDVTARVQGAVKAGASEKEANDQRKEAMAAIEKESTDKTGFRSDVVALYEGGEYWLHRYKKYTDVRLAAAPEQQAAFFGGDPDNFTFPRFDLDFAIFRAYEDGKPVKVEHWLRWSDAGAKDGELVFVSGHPGSTDRLQTLAQFRFTRDVVNPYRLRIYKQRLKALAEYSARGAEEARRAKSMVFGLENSQKAVSGEQDGLLLPGLMEKKKTDEEAFRAAVAKDPSQQELHGGAWAQIEKAIEKQKGFFPRAAFSNWRGSRFLSLAGQIVQLVEEVKKPNGARLREFRDSNLESLKFGLFSKSPIYPDLEEVTLTDAWNGAVEALGADDPFLKAVLDGKTPAEAAKAAIAGTKLGDPEVRKKLVEGGPEAVRASDDPMIVLARRADPIVRELRKRTEDEIESALTTASEQIAKARFSAFGRSVNPDATFTLRLSYGVVKGYELGSTLVPFKTTFHGLYERNAAFDNQPPFDLPPRWLERRKALELSTPYNFVCTTDIIGGNSGSPVINRNAELVGLIFDGNIESLPNRFLYTEDKARAVAVHSAAILETLRKMYDFPQLADELAGKVSR